RGVGVRISPRRLNSPGGQGPGWPSWGRSARLDTGGWDWGGAGAPPRFIRSEGEGRLPDPQLFGVPQSLAPFSNWQRGRVVGLVSVGSKPTGASRPNLAPSSSGEDACLTHRIAQVRVLPGRLPNSRSAGVPAAHLLGREGDRVRFSGGPSVGGIGLRCPGRFLA